MLFQKLAIAASLIAVVAAQEISQDDIPQQCIQVCAQVVTIARDCDKQHDNDNAELQCICNASNANTLIPACEACVRQYDTDANDDDDDDDDDINDNDVREVLTRCNFTVQSSFNLASASSVAASASSAVSAATTSTGSVIVTRTSNGVTQTTAVQTTAIVSQQTQNGAPAVTAAAGMGLGALGFALGMI